MEDLDDGQAYPSCQARLVLTKPQLGITVLSSLRTRHGAGSEVVSA